MTRQAGPDLIPCRMVPGGVRRAAGVSLALLAMASLGEPAVAEEVAVVGGGPIHLRKRTPRVLQDTTAVARIEAGYRVHPRGVARLRIEGLDAEGLNLFCDLVAEVDLGPAYGVQGFAGLSYSDGSGAGNHVGLGAFVRREMSPSVALRADGFAAGVIRTDFAGIGIGVVGGVEWRPRR